jgi:hypothetical protein
MNHNEIQECLEAYSLGALDEPQRDEVRDHVAFCEACRVELDRYEQLVAALPRALAVASPVPPSDVAAQRIRRVIRRRERRSRIATIVAAVAVVMLVVAAGWIVRSERTLADERDRSERLITEQEIIFEVVDSPERDRIVLLPPDDDDADRYGKVFTRPDLPFVVVMAGLLPEPDEGLTYHVWLTFDDGSTTLVGLLTPNEDGFAPLVYTTDSTGPKIADAAVTAQPAGATEPDGEPVLTANSG